MVNSDEKVKVLSPIQLDHHHFGDDWRFLENSLHQVFHINKIEGVIEKIKFPLSPHRKTVYDFLLLTNGKSLRSKGLHEYNIGKNTFFFLPAYQISTHEYMSPDATGYFCHFDQEIFNELYPNLNLAVNFEFWQFDSEPLVVINEEFMPVLLPILERLIYLYENKTNLNINLLSSYLIVLFSELNALTKNQSKNAKNAAQRITEQYKNLLSQFIYKTNRVADYAQMLSVSPDHLNKCVKTTTGRTSQELLFDMILLEAKVLLKQTSLSIAEIAFKFSETNPSDFSRFFKGKVNKTPKEYRQLTDFA